MLQLPSTEEGLVVKVNVSVTQMGVLASGSAHTIPSDTTIIPFLSIMATSLSQ